MVPEVMVAVKVVVLPRAVGLLLAALYLFQLAASLQTWIYRLSTVIQEWYAHDLPIVGL